MIYTVIFHSSAFPGRGCSWQVCCVVLSQGRTGAFSVSRAIPWLCPLSFAPCVGRAVLRWGLAQNLCPWFLGEHGFGVQWRGAFAVVQWCAVSCSGMQWLLLCSNMQWLLLCSDMWLAVPHPCECFTHHCFTPSSFAAPLSVAEPSAVRGSEHRNHSGHAAAPGTCSHLSVSSHALVSLLPKIHRVLVADLRSLDNTVGSFLAGVSWLKDPHENSVPLWETMSTCPEEVETLSE